MVDPVGQWPSFLPAIVETPCRYGLASICVEESVFFLDQVIRWRGSLQANGLRTCPSSGWRQQTQAPVGKPAASTAVIGFEVLDGFITTLLQGMVWPEVGKKQQSVGRGQV